MHYGKPPHGGRDTRRRLDLTFGESLAILLVFHFGGTVLHIPKRAGTNPLDKQKLKRLAKRRDLSANVIARKVGCTRRTVEKQRQRNSQRKG
jgi:hypothetical protein